MKPLRVPMAKRFLCVHENNADIVQNGFREAGITDILDS